MNVPPPSVDPEIAYALLLLSQLYLDTAQKERARQLCLRVSDWKVLLELAEQKYSLTLVYRNLLLVFPDGLATVDFPAIKARVLPYTLRSLQVAAAQARFHADVLKPIKVPHAYIKGPMIADQYYGNLGVRFSRDVDVLVEAGSYPEVVQRAVSSGYNVLANARTGRVIENSQDLRAQLRYKDVISVIAHDHVIIEIHRQLDKSQGLFDSKRLLEDAVPHNLSGVVMHTLSIEWHFLYVCYHSTRHTWSKLHWLADIDAMMNHASFNREAVLSLASETGMRPMIEACIELNKLAKDSGLNGSAVNDVPENSLLALCLRNLDGDREVEMDLRRNQASTDLPFRWLLSPRALNKVRCNRLRARISPIIEQYESLPLPDHLQWIYGPAKPLFWLKWQLSGRRSE